MIGRKPPITDPGQLMMLLYGDGKVGKSTLLAGIPDAVFLDFDGGLRALDVIADDPINTYEASQDAYRQVREMVQNGDPVKTVIFDTLTYLRDLCIAVVEEKGGADIHRVKGGWTEVNKRIEEQLRAYQALGLGVVIVCHAQQTEKELPGGRTIQYNEPALSPKLGLWINGWVDAVLYMTTRQRANSDDVQHLVYTRPGPEYYAGGRYETPPPRIVDIPRKGGWEKLSGVIERAMHPAEKDLDAGDLID
jgi:hypothetical protein